MTFLINQIKEVLVPLVDPLRLYQQLTSLVKQSAGTTRLEIRFLPCGDPDDHIDLTFQLKAARNKLPHHVTFAVGNIPGPNLESRDGFPMKGQ